jgi:O-6-methylguanine DNA methyltransferase
MFWMPWKNQINEKSDAPETLLKTQGQGETFFYVTKPIAKDIFALCAIRGDAFVFIGLSQTEAGLKDVLKDGKSRPIWRKASWVPLEKDLPDILKIELWGTPFQRAVWYALLTIPEGQIVTYQSVAGSVGQPSACRAVGTAIGANPISGIVPCHRVVSKQMDISSYRWGTEIKEAFLRQEQEDLWRKTSYMVDSRTLSLEIQSRLARRGAVQTSLFL